MDMVLLVPGLKPYGQQKRWMKQHQMLPLVQTSYQLHWDSRRVMHPTLESTFFRRPTAGRTSKRHRG
jgi:hypothetical protein